VRLSVSGHPLHTRSLTLVMTRREDGRVDARGVVNDLRKCGFVPLLHGLQPAGIIHQMSIDLVLDPETARIEALETDQPFVAVEPSPWTGGECCRDPAHHLDVLVGETVDGGFPKKLSAAFGGPRGCSHLLTLFQLMASALPRALEREARLCHELGAERAADERFFWRSAFVEGFETREGEIELAVQLHDFQSRPQAAVSRPLDRFHRHEEVRVLARVEVPGFRLAALRAAERVREREDPAGGAWVSHDERVAPLVGPPLIPGLARRVFDRLGDDPSTLLLRDALLQLAPGQIQVMAAITDRWFVEAEAGGGRDASDPRTGPPAGAIGGMVDSCWVWRRDGALGKSRVASDEGDEA